MKKIISKIVAALALAFAIGLAQTARADYWDWVGKGSGQTSYFDEHGNGKGTTGCWYHSVNTGSTDKFASDNHNFENAGSGGRPSFNSGWNKVVTFRKSSAMNGNVNIVYSDATIVFAAEQPAYGIYYGCFVSKYEEGIESAFRSGAEDTGDGIEPVTDQIRRDLVLVRHRDGLVKIPVADREPERR